MTAIRRYAFPLLAMDGWPLLMPMGRFAFGIQNQRRLYPLLSIRLQAREERFRPLRFRPRQNCWRPRALTATSIFMTLRLALVQRHSLGMRRASRPSAG